MTQENNHTLAQQYVDWFRDSSPYINAHRGKTFVLMLPGEAVRHSNFHNIIYDIALLNSLGVRLVIVHGSRPQIQERLELDEMASHFHESLRITDPEAMTAIIQAAGEVRVDIEAALSTGLPNSPMHGAQIQAISGNFVTGMPMGVINGTDLQFTGKVRRINTKTMQQALDLGAILIVSPLGYSPTGEVFNLSFAEVATQVAVNLNADKIVSFVEGRGVEDETGGLIREFMLHEAEQYLNSPNSRPAHGSRLALTACYQACTQGVPRAQIVSFSEDGAFLKELFTRDGSGSMVYRDNYEQLRTATIDDVGGIIELIEPLERAGVLVRRSREMLETEIEKFFVMEKDGTVLACAALYPYATGKAELACVVTHPGYQKGGRAAKLLAQLERQAIRAGIRELFVLTTQTAHWFLEQGFVQGDINALPDEKQSLYNYQRKSKIFVKRLAP
ncbi:amino-acid N-acetyltransferase [Simiduia sp. 21SJ11W-1]|uniref:amino-acid N-acetyltransferase n=1 Tax=Simiduia sp. 21SJ11W-1 TaxID=2909669 RepID=UPI0020A1EDB9|nr:amino-acid N-acetyltransferase [Simiduia sp. 21SJ11W-1]UTA48126.1 amino-acid N-acetyltransferase [Simiduia sp. 21SJ11W-1]